MSGWIDPILLAHLQKIGAPAVKTSHAGDPNHTAMLFSVEDALRRLDEIMAAEKAKPCQTCGKVQS